MYVPVSKSDSLLCKSLLQEVLNRLLEYSANWQLDIAHQKCKVIHFGSKNFQFDYSIDNNLVSCVPYFKDLGIFYNQDLKFSHHCQHLVKKAYKIINILFKVFIVLNLDEYLTAYKSYVLPVLDYCSPVWSPFRLNDIDVIERTQRYFTRRMFSKFHIGEMNYLRRLEFLKLESLELRRLKSDLTYMYKIVHHDIDLIRSDFFTFSQSVTRGHLLKVCIDHSRIDLFKYNYFQRVKKVWNYLPSLVNDVPLLFAKNSKVFRKRLNLVDLSTFLKFDRNLDLDR